MSDFIQVSSYRCQGLEPQSVAIEVLRTRGISQLSISGLPDAWLRDSRDKLRSLVARYVNWGPLDRVLVHLLPPDEFKVGAHLELPIVLGCLAVLDENFAKLLEPLLSGHAFVGSLSLSGEIQHTSQTRSLERLGPDLGHKRVIGPSHFSTLDEFFAALGGQNFSLLPAPDDTSRALSHSSVSQVDELSGRDWEKLWLTAASIFRIPVLMVGPPGVGKSQLALWAHRLLPKAENQDAWVLEQIWELSNQALARNPPLIQPASRSHLSEFLGVARKGLQVPGLFTLAHKGLLILDEFPEMNRDVREILRNILDTKIIIRNTTAGSVSWPADFWLIATANPCPCGESTGGDLSECRCLRQQVQQYQSRLSGPMLDRFGVKLFVGSKRDLKNQPLCETLKHIEENPDQIESLLSEARTLALQSMPEARLTWEKLPRTDPRVSPRTHETSIKLTASLIGLGLKSSDSAALVKQLSSFRDDLFGRSQPKGFHDRLRNLNLQNMSQA